MHQTNKDGQYNPNWCKKAQYLKNVPTNEIDEGEASNIIIESAASVGPINEALNSEEIMFVIVPGNDHDEQIEKATEFAEVSIVGESTGQRYGVHYWRRIYC